MKNYTDLIRLGSATTANPSGSLEDESVVGANDGTFINKNILDPFYKFFWKLIRDAGITPSGLEENETNGYDLVDALVSKVREVNLGLTKKQLQIGDFDMSNILSMQSVAHGLSSTEWKTITSVAIMINNDTFTSLCPIDCQNFGDTLQDHTVAGSYSISSTNFVLIANPGGFFDKSEYSGSGNRGVITFEYTPD